MATVVTKEPRTRTTKIRIEEKESKPGGYEFEFQTLFGGTQRQKYENDGRPGFLIAFSIKDVDRTGLLFPKKPGDAMWVHPVEDENGPCPGAGATWPEFVAENVSADGTTLTVRNYNSCRQLFKFSLNFTRDRDNPDAPLVCWDPIGDNRNGQQF
jgi:hypothetical protein